MSKIVYITGGARSGKSNFAEKQAMAFDPYVVYVATSLAIDQEMSERIAKHRARRPASWNTLEGYKNMEVLLEGVKQDRKALILDCLTIMVSNIMLEEEFDWDNISSERIEQVENRVVGEVEELLRAIRNRKLHTAFLVSNELGMGLVPPYKLGRAFRDIAGRVNQMVAGEADEAYLMVSGLPIRLK
jgi:adenosylcobinamide kinase/adenosylcobinamide-phosphate guanylyltransferase